MKHKRKKAQKFRGKSSHGYGHKKKHRGAGNRGGKGMAGSGKRADQKKPSILKEYGPGYFGKFGFRSIKKYKKKEKTINLADIETNLEKLAKKEGNVYVFDANEKGYTKILGKGKLNKKIKIICKAFSKRAEEKIKKANGEVLKCQ